MEDEVGQALTCWRQASRQLDDIIGIDLDDDVMAPVPVPIDVNVFRRALLAEQLAREHYVALLLHFHEPVPAELLWDAAETAPEQRPGAPATDPAVSPVR